MSQVGSPTSRRPVLAASAGNVLEWYDFGTYGFFAVIIGRQFFPSDDAFASLLSAYGILAVGYMARPIGGVVLGSLGDRIGRRPVMLLSMAVMGVATFAIGLLPDYHRIGDAAPLLLVGLRLIQGFMVAGEYSTSTVFLVEHAAPGRRGYVSSWSMFGAMLGILLGSVVGATVGSLLSDAALHEWGWRVPFLLSLPITILGLLLRRHVAESPAMTASQAPSSEPFLVTFKNHWRALLRYCAMILMAGCGFYLVYVYAISDLTEHMEITTAQALDINSLALFAILLMLPFFGWLSDRIGRKPLAYLASFGSLIGAWPLWWLMHQDNHFWILVGQLGFAVLFSAGWVVYALVMIESLPLRARCFVISIGNGVTYGIFGGLTPLVATYLVERTADDFTPAYMIMAMAVLSAAACLGLRETAGPRKAP